MDGKYGMEMKQGMGSYFINSNPSSEDKLRHMS